MATAGDFQTIDETNAGAGSARLRQSHIGSSAVANRVAGPFEVASSSARTSTARDTLVTALLVIYPAFATVAAIVIGLALTRSV